MRGLHAQLGWHDGSKGEARMPDCNLAACWPAGLHTHKLARQADRVSPPAAAARGAQVCVSARGSPYSCGTWQTYFRASNSTVQLVDGSTPAPSVQLVAAFGQP